MDNLSAPVSELTGSSCFLQWSSKIGYTGICNFSIRHALHHLRSEFVLHAFKWNGRQKFSIRQLGYPPLSADAGEGFIIIPGESLHTGSANQFKTIFCIHFKIH